MPEPMFFDFTQLFDAEEYLYFMEESLRAEDTSAQVSFLEDVLEAKPPMKILDLGCGHGRHANELARRGYDVLGMDLVDGFLDVARRDAEAEGLKVEYVRGDMGSFEIESAFDRVVCLYDAFGFFDDYHQVETLRCVHRALVPDGRFLLDLRTREFMVRLPGVAVLDKGNGDMMIDRQQFDLETGRFVDRRTYVRDGKQREVMFSVRLWAFTEIRLVLQSIGFTIEAAYGGFEKVPISAQRPRTVLVCRRVDPPRDPSAHG
jgi:SAM-dependent methyltransferase